MAMEKIAEEYFSGLRSRWYENIQSKVTNLIAVKGKNGKNRGDSLYGS